MESISLSGRQHCKVDERVKVPMNKVAFLEFVRLVFDTVNILEDELDYGRWASLDKIDK